MLIIFKMASSTVTRTNTLSYPNPSNNDLFGNILSQMDKTLCNTFVKPKTPSHLNHQAKNSGGPAPQFLRNNRKFVRPEPYSLKNPKPKKYSPEISKNRQFGNLAVASSPVSYPLPKTGKIPQHRDPLGLWSEYPLEYLKMVEQLIKEDIPIKDCKFLENFPFEQNNCPIQENYPKQENHSIQNNYPNQEKENKSILEQDLEMSDEDDDELQARVMKKNPEWPVVPDLDLSEDEDPIQNTSCSKALPQESELFEGSFHDKQLEVFFSN